MNKETLKELFEDVLTILTFHPDLEAMITIDSDCFDFMLSGKHKERTETDD